MSVTIRIPRSAGRSGSSRSDGRKAKARGKAKTGKQGRAGQPRTFVEKLLLSLFLVLPLVTLVQTLLARTNGYSYGYRYGAARSTPTETVLSGPGWTYAVPFAVSNKADIQTLIACESGGRNISEPDTDGITSDGILQYHRGPADTMSNGTWEDFSRASGIGGSPNDPAEAIRMTDWAISHGLGPRWTCWRQQGLSPGY
jgi:hypothetical protein